MKCVYERALNSNLQLSFNVPIRLPKGQKLLSGVCSGWGKKKMETVQRLWFPDFHFKREEWIIWYKLKCSLEYRELSFSTIA